MRIANAGFQHYTNSNDDGLLQWNSTIYEFSRSTFSNDDITISPGPSGNSIMYVTYKSIGYYLINGNWIYKNSSNRETLNINSDIPSIVYYEDFLQH